MKKVCVICLLVLVLMISACGVQSPVTTDPSPDNKNVENSNPVVITVDENSTRLNFETGYYKLQDFKANTIEEIKIGLKDADFSGYAPSSQGFFIWGWSAKDANQQESQAVITIVKKYDQDGKLIWERNYEIPDVGYGTGFMTAYQDGFILAVERWPYSEGEKMIYPKSYLIRYSGDGEIIWQKEMEICSGEVFRKVFITEEQDILTIGSWNAENGIQNLSAPSDLLIMKFDSNGEKILQESFGGADFETLLSAGYSEEMGLVASYSTQSVESAHHLITCFDKNLSVKWQYQPEVSEIFNWDQLVVTGDAVYQSGWIVPQLASKNGFLMKLDQEGNLIWHDLSDVSYRTMISLEDGKLAICGTKEDQNFLAVIGSDNKTLYETFSASDSSTVELFPVKGGGFVSLAKRNIKTISQPMYVSSIWYDSEKVATLYDDHLTMIWQKTYDAYHEVLDSDLVHPMLNGKLIVE